MDTRASDVPQNMKSETVEGLQDLARALRDSCQYLNNAADRIDDCEFPADRLRAIAAERERICENIGGFIALSGEKSEQTGTFAGNMRSIWTSFRAGLNSGDPTVVLIEAERAEDAIVHKFEEILPEISGNPINDRMLDYFKSDKKGHDLVRGMRDAYQAA